MKALWTTLFAHFAVGKNAKLFREGVINWFSRTYPRQLTLVLKVSMPSKGVAFDVIQEFNYLLGYIGKNAPRFREICVMDDRVHPNAIHTPPATSPALWGERIMQVVNRHSHKFINLINFNYCRNYYLHQNPLLADMDPPFQLPQAVRQLVLNPGPPDFPRAIAPIPTLQYVEYLDLQGYSLTPTQFLQQLRFCPRITTGLFTIFGHNDLVPVTTPVRLEQIRHLRLFPMMHEERLEFLGTHIDGLSNTLTELTIDGIVRPNPILHSTTLNPHRGGGLTDLTLMNLDMNVHDLFDFLTSCRALKSLCINLPLIRETGMVGILHRSTNEPQTLGVLPVLEKFSLFIHMDIHPYFPSFFEDMVKSRRNESLLRDSSSLIKAVTLIHLGVGDKPEVDELRESLADLTGFELNIDGPIDRFKRE